MLRERVSSSFLFTSFHENEKLVSLLVYHIFIRESVSSRSSAVSRRRRLSGISPALLISRAIGFFPLDFAGSKGLPLSFIYFHNIPFKVRTLCSLWYYNRTRILPPFIISTRRHKDPHLSFPRFHKAARRLVICLIPLERKRSLVVIVICPFPFNDAIIELLSSPWKPYGPENCFNSLVWISVVQICSFNSA